LDDDFDFGPPGPCVVLDRLADTWAVFFDLPMPDGERRVTFQDKNSAWGHAMAQCREHRFGFRDDANTAASNRNAALK
jgi:hypothetical protein